MERAAAIQFFSYGVIRELTVGLNSGILKFSDSRRGYVLCIMAMSIFYG